MTPLRITSLIVIYSAGIFSSSVCIDCSNSAVTAGTNLGNILSGSTLVKPLRGADLGRYFSSTALAAGFCSNCAIWKSTE